VPNYFYIPLSNPLT